MIMIPLTDNHTLVEREAIHGYREYIIEKYMHGNKGNKSLNNNPINPARGVINSCL
jgi:hypothetical protein